MSMPVATQQPAAAVSMFGIAVKRSVIMGAIKIAIKITNIPPTNHFT